MQICIDAKIALTKLLIFLSFKYFECIFLKSNQCHFFIEKNICVPMYLPPTSANLVLISGETTVYTFCYDLIQVKSWNSFAVQCTAVTGLHVQIQVRTVQIQIFYCTASYKNRNKISVVGRLCIKTGLHSKLL